MLKNTYHRFLDIPVDPNVDLFSRTDYDPMNYCHVRVDQNQINPELISWFNSIGITFDWFEGFYTPPNGGKLPVHTDTPNVCNVVKINWTYGAPNSKLIWWKPNDEKLIKTVKTDFGQEYLTIEEEHCTKLFEVAVKKPSLVNIGLFHSTYNPSPEGRWTLSLRLMSLDSTSRLTWDEAIEKLKIYFDKDHL
jgi:hypothetical protein